MKSHAEIKDGCGCIFPHTPLSLRQAWHPIPVLPVLSGIDSFHTVMKLFSDTPRGAEASAIVYTMIEMARAHELNIYKYLNYLLKKLPSTKMTDTEFAKLAPWNQTVIADCSGAM